MPGQRLTIRCRLLVGAVACTFLVACSGQSASVGTAAAARPSDDPAWPVAAVADPATPGFTADGLAALDARMAQAVADQDVAGLVYILARRGEVAAFGTHGIRSGDARTGTPMTRDSIFRIYSMTKPITGVAMMQLYEKGLWQLDDPVTRHVPEFANLKRLTWKNGKPIMGADGQPVLADASRPPTMREIMSHTAGFGYGLCCTDPKGPNWNPADAAFVRQGVLGSATLEEMIVKIAGIPLFDDPGARWRYSVSVDIQGYIVQKLSGQTFGEYLKTHVFTPLGMHDTAFFVSQDRTPRFADVYRWDPAANGLVVQPGPPGRPAFSDPHRLEGGGGGLISSTHDYARFVQMMLNRGTLGGATLLKPETVALMAENHIGQLGIYSDGTTANSGRPGQTFGLDVAVYVDPAAGKHPYGAGTYYWGGAAGTWFWIDPKNDLFFIGMIQSLGGRRDGAMDMRGGSAELVYKALR